MPVNSEIEVWGGMEYTLNRVGDEYHDQLEYTGHYYRKDDIDTIATLGIKTLRYPILWERHQPHRETVIDWSFSERNLLRLRALGIKPVVGLVHHGSGPEFVSFFDGSFEKGLSSYAGTVAEKFPWIEYYTPVNEPLTTARFCGLYGHWYPHKRDEHSFYTILLSECKATVMAMQTIRQINPHAKLIQTEDLGKTYSTSLLQYQARFDNHRRWISFDLLCGKVNEQHPLWNYLISEAGISVQALQYFTENTCSPDICGLNYYMTSERYLDENLAKYPEKYHSGNGCHLFADVERIRIDIAEDSGAKMLLKEACKHLQLPIAVTECHLHCTRDEQMRWFSQMWQAAHELKTEGIDIRAVTAWALFGTYGWDKLMIEPGGTYETGAFKITTGYPMPTAFAKLLQTLSAGKVFHHPVLKHKGWWQRNIRAYYGITEAISIEEKNAENEERPLLLVGEAGILKEGFRHICFERNLPIVFIDTQDIDLNNRIVVDHLLQQYNPWAVISIDGFENASGNSALNTIFTLAAACNIKSIKLSCFSPEPSEKQTGSLLCASDDKLNALRIYEATNTQKEKDILALNEDVLIIRTGLLYSPWDENNLVNKTVKSLLQNDCVSVSDTRYSSFAYVPDVIHIGLDWLLDGESGVYYMANSYDVNERYLVVKTAKLSGKDLKLITIVDSKPKVQQRCVQLLPMDKRIKLPYLENALQRYIETVIEMKQNVVEVSV